MSAASNNGTNVAAGQPRPRVFMDLSTSLILSGRQAMGILRTEREIARRLLKEPRIVAIPFVFSSGSICALDRADALRLVGGPSGPEGLTARLHHVGHRPFALVAAPMPVHTAHPTPRRMPVRARLRKLARHVVDIMPAAIREDVRLVLIHGREAVRKTLRPQRPDASALIPDADQHTEIAQVHNAMCGRRIEIGWPEAGDVLWTCGHYGVYVPLRLIAEARWRLGFSCVVICYDLIRNEHPEWNPEKPHRFFYDCVAADLLDGGDRILCISGHTRSRLIAFAAKYGRDAPDARVVTLGCDLLAVAPEAALPKELAGRRFALSVGSVERRKNLGTLVRIWELLSDYPGFDLDLVLVGRAAEWDEAAVCEVEASPLLGRRIFWFDECSDGVLKLLYRQADALLYPSFAEGWGLPVAEALAVGTPVVASNAGAIPEAASGSATLLDPGDMGAWRNAILDLAASTPPRLPPLQPPTWDAAATAVVSHILEVARARAV